MKSGCFEIRRKSLKLMLELIGIAIANGISCKAVKQTRFVLVDDKPQKVILIDIWGRSVRDSIEWWICIIEKQLDKRHSGRMGHISGNKVAFMM
jgi:hypothetical protein